MLQVFLAEDPEIEYLFCGAPSGSETCLKTVTCNMLDKLVVLCKNDLANTIVE